MSRFLAAAVLSLAVLAHADAPPTLTVEEYKADVKKYADKAIRVTGVVQAEKNPVVVTASVDKPMPFVMCDDPSAKVKRGDAVVAEATVDGSSMLGKFKSCKLTKK